MQKVSKRQDLNHAISTEKMGSVVHNEWSSHNHQVRTSKMIIDMENPSKELDRLLNNQMKIQKYSYTF